MAVGKREYEKWKKKQSDLQFRIQLKFWNIN